jgi:hypothetical protein
VTERWLAILCPRPSFEKHPSPSSILFLNLFDTSNQTFETCTLSPPGKNFLLALEPNYGKVEGMGVLERSGFSPDLIRSMLENNALWTEPLQFFGERAARLKVSDFIQAPSENEYIDENATLGEATHQLIVQPYLSLLVTNGDEVVGILRLSDVFTKICDIIRGG